MKPSDLKRFALFLQRHVVAEFGGMADRVTALDSAHLEYACCWETDWEWNEVCETDLAYEMKTAGLYHDTDSDLLIG